MYYVYVLYSREVKKFYIGYTEDIKRRIGEHKKGLVHTTHRYPDIDLVFYEYFILREDAQRREKYLKTTKGRKFLKIVLRETIK